MAGEWCEWARPQAAPCPCRYRRFVVLGSSLLKSSLVRCLDWVAVSLFRSSSASQFAVPPFAVIAVPQLSPLSPSRPNVGVKAVVLGWHQERFSRQTGQPKTIGLERLVRLVRSVTTCCSMIGSSGAWPKAALALAFSMKWRHAVGQSLSSTPMSLMRPHLVLEEGPSHA